MKKIISPGRGSEGMQPLAAFVRGQQDERQRAAQERAAIEALLRSPSPSDIDLSDHGYECEPTGRGCPYTNLNDL